MRTPQGKGEVPLLYLVPGLYLWAIYTVGRLPLMLPLGQACGNMYNAGPDVEFWSTPVCARCDLLRRRCSDPVP